MDSAPSCLSPLTPSRTGDIQPFFSMVVELVSLRLHGLVRPDIGWSSRPLHLLFLQEDDRSIREALHSYIAASIAFPFHPSRSHSYLTQYASHLLLFDFFLRINPNKLARGYYQGEGSSVLVAHTKINVDDKIIKRLSQTKDSVGLGGIENSMMY